MFDANDGSHEDDKRIEKRKKTNFENIKKFFLQIYIYLSIKSDMKLISD